MMDDNDLQRLLNRPDTPDSLESKIRANWHEQIKQSRRSLPIKPALIAASIAGIIVFITALNFILAPQNLVSVAMKDINKDESEHTGITLPVSYIIEKENINLPPNDMIIAMTKSCNLAGNKTIHMKIDGARQGAVHLFIKHGTFDTSNRIPETSSRTAMRWKIIRPRSDLTVLVIYTNDMNPAGVTKLIQTMFYT